MAGLEKLLAECEGFEWDTGNFVKTGDRHQASPAECEEIFFNRPFIVHEDKAHSADEPRVFALGQTDAGRLMFMAFTIRGRLIRVISARDESQRAQGLFVVMKKHLPKFEHEDAERKFWAIHDSTDYIDWRGGQRTILPNLKPTSQTISLRLPKPMLDRLKQLANKRDVPYQSLLKMFVADRLKAELGSD